MAYKEHIEATLRLLARIRQANDDPHEALERLLACFAELLSEIPLTDVYSIREMLTKRIDEAHVDGEELLCLIDGHIAFRELLGN